MPPDEQPSEAALLAKCTIVGSLIAAYLLDTWWIVPIVIVAILLGRFTAHHLGDK